MTYREWIEDLKREWIGRRIWYKGHVHTIVDIDYNGSLMIDLPTEHNATTALCDATSYAIAKAGGREIT